MKKILKFAAVLSAVVLFASCGSKDDKTLVKETVDKYLEASISMDYDAMKSLVTKESEPALEYYKQAADAFKALPAEAQKAAKDAAKAASESITVDAESVKIDGDKATISVNTMGVSAPYALKKVDGKWLIDLMGGYDVEVDEVDVDVEEPAGDTTEVEEVEVVEETTEAAAE